MSWRTWSWCSGKHARDGYSERPSILPLFTESRFMISIIAADAVGFGQQFQKKAPKGNNFLQEALENGAIWQFRTRIWVKVTQKLGPCSKSCLNSKKRVLFNRRVILTAASVANLPLQFRCSKKQAQLWIVCRRVCLHSHTHTRILPRRAERTW